MNLVLPIPIIGLWWRCSLPVGLLSDMPPKQPLPKAFFFYDER